ncbi:hypothetical protein ACR77J_05915 [Tissierella praeacuta]|uniref:hypothetical protein n=1 Tax=Tissierella praeacuta TaxID=43131 RepID=UPI003DA3B6B1
MITRINKTHELLSLNYDIEVNGKLVSRTNHYEYNPNSDYSFLDLDRIINAVIERYLGVENINQGISITTPQFQNDGMDKRDLKFSKEFFDIIKPLVDTAYERKSLSDLGDLEYHKYEEYIAKKVYNIASIAREVVREFSNIYNKPTYDEHSLRKAADDYFMEQLNKKDVKSIDNDSVTNQHDNIRNVAKFRIMNDKECRNILAELKTLI